MVAADDAHVERDVDTGISRGILEAATLELEVMPSMGTLRGPALPATNKYASSLAGKAYRQIRDAIAGLVLQPGQILTEASLSEWLEIGRMPVREALLRLRDEGLVESVPRKGYYVSRISAEEAGEIYEMLEGLEGVAARLATARKTPEGLARLEDAISRMEEALVKDDLDAWASADSDVHDAILEMAGNEQIKRVALSLKARVTRLQIFTVRKRSRLSHSTKVHRLQFEAIRSGDGRKARELRQDLWMETGTEVVDIVRRYGGASASV